MTMPIIAATTGAILIILQAVLMVAAGAYRGQSGINLGTGGDPVMERKVRRHGNLAENAGLFVAVLALAEMILIPNIAVKIIAIIFVVTRLAHAIALSTEAGSHGAKGGKIFIALRVIGAMGTLGTFLALGGYILYTVV